MDSVKEKLVELLNNAAMEGQLKGNRTWGYIADHLIAHGVTVQDGEDNNVPTKWISVKDRLPEEWKTVLVFMPSIDAIIPAKLRGGSWYATWDTTRLKYVSYWMPMPEKPQPPKGE